MEHAECDKVVRPYREQQLLVFTESCKICGCHCQSLIEFFQHYDIHHYGLHCCICAICRNIYLSESMLMFHITKAHGGPVTFKWLLAEKCLYKYDVYDKCVYFCLFLCLSGLFLVCVVERLLGYLWTHGKCNSRWSSFGYPPILIVSGGANLKEDFYSYMYFLCILCIKLVFWGLGSFLWIKLG